MTYLIVALVVLLAIVLAQAVLVHHLAGQRDTATTKARRECARADRLLLWGTALRAQIIAEREAEQATVADADDALRARHRARDTAIQYGHPADDRKIHPVILPGPRTGDLADTTTTHDTQEVAR